MTTKNTKRVLEDIANERTRQITQKKYTAHHDDQYQQYELARAAGCYAINPRRAQMNLPTVQPPGGNQVWPWELKHWRPEGERSDLVKAAALLVAEIERMDRHAAQRAE